MTEKLTARPAALEPLHEASVTYRYMAPPGHTLEHCLSPEYWRHNARECRHSRLTGRNSWNRIEVIAEDGSWEADLRILSVDSTGLVETRVLRHWEPAPKPGRKAMAPDGYRVEHIPEHGWRAIDRNGEMVAQKLSTEAKAIEAASDHARKVKGNS